jgi:hypothetical protein
MTEIWEEGALVVKVAISDPPVKRFPKMDRLYGVPPAPERNVIHEDGAVTE